MRSSLEVYNKTHRGFMVKNSLGYFHMGGNSLINNKINIALFTSSYKIGNGISIIPQNFYRTTMLLTARKLIDVYWINSRDEYKINNIN
jgi:hypothetical protein